MGSKQELWVCGVTDYRSIVGSPEESKAQAVQQLGYAFTLPNGFGSGIIIQLQIKRNNNMMFKGSIAISQMKRPPKELVSFIYRESSFPYGCLTMTGTGIVPENDFTLQSSDE